MNSQALHQQMKAGWNTVAAAKYRAEQDAQLQLLRSGGHTLLPVELTRLGAILPTCRRVIHLQCSHGLDALGLLNLGVAEVVGLDISEEMIRLAHMKTEALGARARWYCTDILDAPHELDGTADLVYTGRGALPWMMELAGWAQVVWRLVRAGGRVFVFEGHPLDRLWDPEARDLRLAEGSGGYFAEGGREPLGFPVDVVSRVWQQGERPVMLERQWRPGEVIGSLIGVGFRLEHFDEHPTLYWEQFPCWAEREKVWLPHSYTLMARKDEAQPTSQSA